VNEFQFPYNDIKDRKRTALTGLTTNRFESLFVGAVRHVFDLLYME
jgi:hypothetical protein